MPASRLIKSPVMGDQRQGDLVRGRPICFGWLIPWRVCSDQEQMTVVTRGKAPSVLL